MSNSILKKITREHLLLFIIIVFAALLRLYRITSLPPSLNWDEVSHGYNAYSILETGRDEWGKPFPVIFRAYGDYKLPVYIYLTVMSEALFGVNAFAVRLPSAMAGVGTVIVTYFLVRLLFIDVAHKSPLASRIFPLLAALLVAVEPWSLFLSRIALEANVALFLITSGAYLFLKGMHERPGAITYMVISVILFGLSVWTYNSARIFTPMLLAALIFIYWNEFRKAVFSGKTNLIIIILAGLVFFAPMFIQLINPQGQARYGWVKILDQGAINSINESRGTSVLPSPLPRILHNKATYLAGTFITNYFSHFSSSFLFSEGGSHYQFSIPGRGMLYLVNLPFMLIGAYALVRNAKHKGTRLVFVWLLIAPVAASLTRDAPHALRSIVILPMPMIFSAAGVVAMLKFITEKSRGLAVGFISIYLLLVLFSLESYAEEAVFKYRDEYAWAWQYGHKEMVDFVRNRYGQYDSIIITKKYGEPHEFLLFHWPWDPARFQAEDKVRFFQSDWYWVDSFDKFYFVNDKDIPANGEQFTLESGGVIECGDKKCLLVTSPKNAPLEWSLIKTVNYPDGQAVFEFYE